MGDQGGGAQIHAGQKLLKDGKADCVASAKRSGNFHTLFGPWRIKRASECETLVEAWGLA